MEEGIYFNMPMEDYQRAGGLSNSGIKSLYVSPLNYWHDCYNPNKKRSSDTRAQMFGTALHCRILEPERFNQCYAKALSKDDYHGCLETMDDLREFCTTYNLSTSAKKKQDLIDRIKDSADVLGFMPVIWDDVKSDYLAENEGKNLLSTDEWDLIQGAADSALSDTYIAALLSSGWPEVSIFVRDESGVMLKCRIDWMRLNCTVDLKSFNNARGKKSEKAILDTLYYEGYYHQAEFYDHVRGLARKALEQGRIKTHDAPDGFDAEFIKNKDHAFVLVFVESAEPYHLGMKVLKEREHEKGEANLYWTAATNRRLAMIELYQECRKKYGKNPWREPCLPQVLNDLDLPQLMFS